MATYVWRHNAYLSAGTHTIETRNTVLGADPVVHVWNGSSPSVWDDDGNGAPNSRVTFTVPAGGAWYTFIMHAWKDAFAGTTDVYFDNSLLEASAFFGGVRVGHNSMDPLPGGSGFQYETALPPFGATDTYIFGRNASGAIVAMDDDGGVGYASRITNSSIAEIMLSTYAYGQQGLVNVYANDASNDADTDGLGWQLEKALGTCDRAGDPGCAPPGGIATYKDSDHDGLLDAAEVFGIESTTSPLLLPRWGADPRHIDVFFEVDWSTAFTSQPYTAPQMETVQALFSPAPAEVNLDGTTGIRLHFDVGFDPSSGTLYGNWGGANGGLCNGDCGVPVRGGTLATNRLGVFHAIKVTSGGGGGAGGGGLNIGVSAPSNVFGHEIGHSLGLQHWGHDLWGRAEFKPNYKSVMSTGGWNPPVQFSTGSVSQTLDPGAVSERDALLGDPGGLPVDPWWFNTSTGGGHFDVDWNHDGLIADNGTTLVRANVTWSTWDVPTHHLTNLQKPAESVSVANASPRIITHYAAAGGKRLYIFFVGQDGTIKYVHSPYSDPGWDGSCPGGSSPGATCTTWSSIITVPGPSNVSSVTALEYGGNVVLAYTEYSGQLRSVYATGRESLNYVLTGWTSWGSLGSSSGQPELSVMFVEPTYFGGSSEVIGLFYPVSDGYRWYSTTSPGGYWTYRDSLKDAAGANIAGPTSGLTSGPAVIPWPGRDVAFGAARRSVAALTTPSNTVAFYQYDKSTDRWSDLTSYAFGGAGPTTSVRPTLVYHLLRDSAGNRLGDGSRGQFFLFFQGTGADPELMFTERREIALPPDSTIRFKWRGNAMPWIASAGLGPLNAIAAFEDSSLGAMKGAALARHGLGTPPTYDLNFFPLFDGTGHAALKDGSDFRVLHMSLCQSLYSSPTAICGTTNAWGY
ncbi:MAG: hypothetical protein JNL79_08485 [Myxococcales bacterium]|nr:hypothetical protein [Myxococcales bacterium]